MPIVFVHGVPETAALWNDLRAELRRADTLALALPGFGCPRPAGFSATKEAYVDWLVRELERIGPTIDLVSHDWGGAFALRAVSLHPELVRSWVSDAAGIADVEFEWHAFAKIWQTPGAGEQWFRDQFALPIDERAATFAGFGVPRSRARDLAAGIDPTMGECILPLYRSAVDVGREWAPAIRNIRSPGLVVVATDDPFVTNPGGAERTAAACGARTEHLEGLGHWWALQDPKRSAEVLERFWASLG